jgi:glycosyltransferase involved in cell wall biosynthesis
VPYHFANLRRSPPLAQYLTRVLSLCPRGGRTCETGVGTGFGAIWLSLRGVRAEGIDYSMPVVERARQTNNVLGGSATFRYGNLFHLFEETQQIGLGHYHVIHHQGVLEHFGVPWIRAALAQQVALAEWVVFSVPSVHYNCEPEFGDERLLPIEEWERILAPFDIAELHHYGGPNGNDREQILCVLRGQAVDEELLSLMSVPEEPYPQGISAIVHTRNEARHIAECLQTLQGWTDEILVCDMESTDETVEIARSHGAEIVLHPLIPNFDRARNVSAMRAQYRWVFYLDADERVPPGLGVALKNLVLTQGDCFEAVHPPFKHYFAGRWMQSLYPGYTAPRLLKNGRFYFNPRLHSGAVVDGRTVQFPADNPDLALIHHSYDNLHHYLEKLNRYTDGEAADMHRDGQPYHWQRAMRHFLQDFVGYYDRGRAYIDGPHGFIWSFQSAFYRFEQHAKLFEHRFRQGQLRPEECQVPVSVRQLFEFALSVLDEKPPLQASFLRIAPVPTPDAAQVVWSGPLLDPSGYGEESRHLLFALQEAGASVAAQVLPWNQDAKLNEEERECLNALVERPVSPGFVQIVHDFPYSFARHPQAGVAIGRTVFETDRLPQPWVEACNRMDFIWVPSEFNRVTFAQAGVAAEKLVVIPECFDPTPYRTPGPPDPLLQSLRDQGKFVFLSVFDWTRHKGWDVLLQGFIEAFEGHEDVALVLKVWSTLGYSHEEIQRQAMEFLKQETGHDLLTDGRIRWRFDRLTREEMIALYRGADAFVLPSRGEGWGRPYMEAMACAVPTIGTNWSGNTAFMTQENSFLIDHALQPVPESAWKELPTYRGHRWAEPDREHLKQQMRRVIEARDEAKTVGQRAQEEVCERFSRAAVGPQVAAEIARITALQRSHPHGMPVAAAASVPAALREQHERNEPTEPQEEPLQEGMVRDRRSSSGRKRTVVAAAPTHPLAVRWEGDFFQWHSLAHVNRELCLQLQSAGTDLSLIPSGHTHFLPESVPRFASLGPRTFAPLSSPVDVHVRHFFPPRLERPDEGRFVLIQPWEYGYLPRAWVEPIQQNVDEVWCYSRYVREVYRVSGIPEEKLHIVPLGVDAETFSPEAPPYLFTNEPGAGQLQREAGSAKKPFVFLFVGGTLKRKGIDILLEAYLRAFSAYDDVVLVIKDTGTQTVYRGQNEREQILKFTDDPSRPAIVYLEHDLLPHPLAGVYTAADCLVQPYRGEGFCLPALEAMACGLPVIVPEGGPTDDFVDEGVGWRVPAERKPLAEQRVGPWDCVGTIWQFEIASRDLAKAMRQAYSQPEEVTRKGQAAREKVVVASAAPNSTCRRSGRSREGGGVLDLAALRRISARPSRSPPRQAPPHQARSAPCCGPTPQRTWQTITRSWQRGQKRGEAQAHARQLPERSNP